MNKKKETKNTLQEYKFNEFYNNDNKLIWIETSNLKDKPLINTIFSYAKLYEESKGADICTFAGEDIKAFYEGFYSVSIDKLCNVNSYLKQYTDWCIKNELVPDHQNHFKNVDYVVLGDFISKDAVDKSFFTRDQLIQWAEECKRKMIMVNPCDLSIIWLLFEGVRGDRYKEIFDIEYNDIDPDTCIAKLSSGREIQLSRECVDFILSTKDIQTYILPSFRERQFLDDKIYRSFRKDQLDRDSRGSSNLVKQLNRRLVGVMEQLDLKNTSLKSIIACGQIDMIKNLASKANKPIEDYIASQECYEAVYKQYGVKTWIGPRFFAKYKNQFNQ